MINLEEIIEEILEKVKSGKLCDDCFTRQTCFCPYDQWGSDVDVHCEGITELLKLGYQLKGKKYEPKRIVQLPEKI